MATIDTYLDELLGPAAPPPAARAGLAAEAAQDAPPGAGDGATAGADAAVVHDAGGPAADDDAMARIAADVMAELLADPALSGGLPADVADAAPPARAEAPPMDVAPPVASLPERPAALAPSPAPVRAPAVPDLSAFMPPPASPIAPIARTAVALADPARARTATGGHRWLRVCVGADSYAFELLRVQEVVRVAPVVAMRGAAHAVLGVMNLRGRIVPVFDLGLWLDVGAVRVEERARIVVIERNDELIGVLVTAVDDVVSLEREHVEPPLPGADPGPTLGVARVTAAPTVLLDADALFD